MENYCIIAESEDGQYEPIGEAVTFNEALEIAASDMAHRLRELKRGNCPMCPYEYRAWGRCADGTFAPVRSWLATDIPQVTR